MESIVAVRRPGRAGWVLAVIAAALALGSVAQAQDMVARLNAHVSAPGRSAEDRRRDEVRRPIEVMQFLGVEDGMTALDVISVAGWYTGILSAAVGPSGKVYSQNPAFFLNQPGFVDAETARNAALGNVEAIHGDITGIDGRVDVAICNQNLHDIYNGGGDAAALPLLRSIYAALKPGGVLGLMDHVGVAGQPNAELHRMEVDEARRLLVEAGFVVEAESMLLRNRADDHTKGPGDESLGGDSDRFLLKARKPR